MVKDRGGRAPVIADVARLAEVSVPTVSRVLTGAKRVTPEKKDRVLAAISELNYRPSAVARALVTRQSQTIAVVAGNTYQYGYQETIRGIEEAARADEYTVTITVIETAKSEEVTRALNLVLKQSPNGVVVLNFDPPAAAVLSELPPSLPVVAISGTRDTSRPQAVLDESRAAQALIGHLLELGHSTVHHVRVPAANRREDRRTIGWRRALKAAGAEVPPPFHTSWDPLEARSLGHDLAQRSDITAIFCGNDEVAMGLMKGLFESGISVPEDISVVGFDDHPLAAVWRPALTTVNQDFAQLGHRAFALLKTAMGESAGTRFSSALPTLIIRDSTAVPKDQRPAERSKL